MTGATGNIYCGLHEYADMAFVLHLLRKGDLFLDLGANIGSYTILASKISGAHTIAVEPDSQTVLHLRRNVEANGMGDLVEIVEAALGAEHGMARFSIGRDTTNQVVADVSLNSREVKLMPLDVIVGNREPVMIKMDVEGYEAQVLKGARETLRKPSLIAIETETSDADVLGILTGAGFERYCYDARSREIAHEPFGTSASNALYLRDIASVKSRLAQAPRHQILGQVV